MKILSILVFLFTLMFILDSCKKNENYEFTDSPIIESYIFSGNGIYVNISRQIPFLSDVAYSSDDINNLDVYLDYKDSTKKLTSVGGGIYTDSSINITTNVKYTLRFKFNNKNVSAYTTIPGKPLNFKQSATSISIARMDSASGPPSMNMPDPIELTWDNPDGSYYLVIVENVEETLDPIRDFGDADHPGPKFKQRPINSSGTELRSMEFQYYGTHRIIIFHVLPDYASLYDDNSSNSLNLTNPSTSITNGYGIFTGLDSDTLWVEVNEAK